ncbi:MAG: hypothetical protein KME42_24655 [Tildeniella nuda ZEHNDER 1965/U140]|jgi:hypothetical protein|nr:hypothetical protein [Tildeniella nuda ZEHNDER 1965/U140]
MRNLIFNAISPWFSQVERSRSLLAGLSLTVGLLGAGLLPAIATSAQSAPRAQATKQVLPDGVYLYGQSTQPDQVGQGYFVFEAKQGNVVGALYMPRSSFDCTSGKFQNEQLALTVVNSYDRTANPFEIALERTSNVAAEGNPAFQNIGLQGFQRLSKVSENDYRILNVCKADFQKQAKK